MPDNVASRVIRVIAAGANVMEDTTPEATRQFPQPSSPGGVSPLVDPQRSVASSRSASPGRIVEY
jgi:hypothetical protein